MTKTFSVYVTGRPAPQGSKRLGEHGQVREQSPYLAAWRGLWKGREGTPSRKYHHGAIGHAVYAAYAARGILPDDLPLWPDDEPVSLSIGFYLNTSPTQPPDLDKLVRAVGDALTVCRVFRDDAQVARLFADKYRADREHPQGAYIAVSSPWWPEPAPARGITRIYVPRIRRQFGALQ